MYLICQAKKSTIHFLDRIFQSVQFDFGWLSRHGAIELLGYGRALLTLLGWQGLFEEPVSEKHVEAPGGAAAGSAPPRRLGARASRLA